MELLDLGVDGRHLERAGRRGHRGRRGAAARAQMQTTAELVQELVEHHHVHVLAQQVQQKEVTDLKKWRKFYYIFSYCISLYF